MRLVGHKDGRERQCIGMSGESAGFGAFYRRHEDQVLGCFLAIVTVAVLMLLIVTAEEDADQLSRPAVATPSHPNANQDTVPKLSRPLETPEVKRRTVQTANKWAREFAAPGALRGACTWSQPTCRMVCQRWNRPGQIRNCTPPSRAFRRSFRGATVQEFAINGDRAAARFSNGETVELFGVPIEERWVIDKFGENAGRGFFK
jgi:hypothetical protein